MKDKHKEDSLDLLAVNEVLRGKTDSYSDIVNRYQQYLTHLSRSYLGNREEAEDAAQEIFIKVYRSLHTFKLTQRFHPWFYTIAMNHLKSKYSSLKRQCELREKEAQRETPLYKTPEDQTLLNDSLASIHRVIEILPVKLREVVILYYLEEMSVSEIAEILKISEENVKSRLHRSRKKLKIYLTESATCIDR